MESEFQEPLITTNLKIKSTCKPQINLEKLGKRPEMLLDKKLLIKKNSKRSTTLRLLKTMLMPPLKLTPKNGTIPLQEST
jgi:hypothetical protein